MWRKNRKKHTALCTGTDLNRNADYFWNTAGTGALCIQDNYAGPSVASEVETQAVTKAVSALKDDLLAYYSTFTDHYSYTTCKIFPISL